MQRSALCRSRRELSNAYLLAKIGVDTAENEPLEVWGKIQFTIHFTPYLLVEKQGRREKEVERKGGSLLSKEKQRKHTQRALGDMEGRKCGRGIKPQGAAGARTR